jgi:hypothetical protein
MSEILTLASWSSFKSIVLSKKLLIQYDEAVSSYYIWAYDQNALYNVTILKTSPTNPDQVDFETNYKPTANAPINIDPVTVQQTTQLSDTITAIYSLTFNTVTNGIQLTDLINLSAQEVTQLSTLELYGSQEITQLTTLQLYGSQEVVQLTNLNTVLSQQTGQLTTLQLYGSQEVTQLSNLNAAVALEVTQLTTVNVTLAQEVAQLSTLNTTATTGNIVLSNQTTQLSTVQFYLNQEIAQLTTLNTSNNSQVTLLSQEIAQLTTLNTSNNSQVTLLSQEIAQLTTTNAQLSAQTTQMTTVQLYESQQVSQLSTLLTIGITATVPGTNLNQEATQLIVKTLITQEVAQLSTIISSPVIGLTLGQKLGSGSLPVVLPSDQTLNVAFGGVSPDLTAQRIFTLVLSNFNIVSSGVETNLILFKNPSGNTKTYYIKGIFFNNRTKTQSGVFTLRANPTVTANGVTLTVVNTSIGSGVASTINTFSGPTTSALGTIVGTYGTGAGQNDEQVRIDWFALPANNSFLLTGIGSNNNTNVDVTIIWVEL